MEGVVSKKIRLRYYNSELLDNKFVMLEHKINSIEGNSKLQKN